MKNARSIIQSKRTKSLSLSKSSALVVPRKRHWEKTAAYSPDCWSPAKHDNVICKNSSDMKTSHHLPPSVMGVNFNTCLKSQLTEILHAQVDMPERAPEGEVIIVVGSAMVNSIPPRTSKKFEDYAREDILPKIKFNGATYKRVDAVFDVVYRKSTVKGEARVIRRSVTGTSKTPINLRSFLRDDDNKTELFQFLADRICQTQTTSTIIVKKEGCVICNDNHKSLEAVSPCLHEEADTRIFVHARDAAIEGSKALVIKANDTDTVAIAVSVVPQLQEIGIETLWTAFGHGVGMTWIPTHELLNVIGPARGTGIMYFHAFTECGICLQRKGEEIGMADMGCIWWGHGNLQ